MSFHRVAIAALFLSSALTSAASSAQERVQLALFKTAAEDPALAELAAALDPVLLSALGERSGVEVAAQPAVDLPSAQLAIDCVGETADCLRAAAQQVAASALLAPAVRRDADATTVTLLYFQPGEAPIRRAERRYSGERQGQQALGGVAGMLAELFPAPPPPLAAEPPPPETVAPLPAAPPPTAAKPQAERGVPVVPVVLGGVGVVLLGTSIAFGAMASASQDAYADIVVKDKKTAELAQSELDKARTQATVTNVTLGLGIGALVAGGVLLIWQLGKSSSHEQAHLTPRVAKGELGLTLSAAWGGGR